MLTVENIEKMYEGKPLLRGISFELKQGETICLLGRSGSGKSTLLRIIVGIELPDSGRILWAGKDMANVPIHERNFGLMFQDYALFPHKNVFNNVAFGLRMIGVPADQVKKRVEIELNKVGMLNFSRRRVTELSGGEQQRVALARALVPKPRLLLLDEPLGALDKTLRGQLLQDIHTLLLETGIPAIYVTHDQEEAFRIADRLLILRDGEIVQSGAPQSIYRDPKDTWVAKFLGLNNILPARIVRFNPLTVETDIGELEIEPFREIQYKIGQEVDLLIRPDALIINQAGNNQISGKVKDVFFLGEGYHVIVKLNSTTLEFDLAQELKIGDAIQGSLDANSVSIL